MKAGMGPCHCSAAGEPMTEDRAASVGPWPSVYTSAMAMAAQDMGDWRLVMCVKPAMCKCTARGASLRVCMVMGSAAGV